MTTGDHWLDGLLDMVGKPIPCGICGTPTPASDLTETTVPAGVSSTELGDIVVEEIIWVCPACPPFGVRP